MAHTLRIAGLVITAALWILPDRSMAAAGIADMAKTRTIWVTDSYALIEDVDNDDEPLTSASLWRARRAKAGEIAFQNDIVPQERVIGGIVLVHVEPLRYLWARTTSGETLVIDINHSVAQAKVIKVLDNGLELGTDTQLPAVWLTFEEYLSRQGKHTRWVIVLVCGSVLAVTSAVLFCVVRRRRMVKILCAVKR